MARKRGDRHEVAPPCGGRTAPNASAATRAAGKHRLFAPSDIPGEPACAYAHVWCLNVWLASGFEHPGRVELPTGHHLRPIRAGDVDIDYPAVMGSRERLWARYGEPWGWPPATMSYEEDKADLARHEAEIAAHETFNYAVLDERETRLLGCVYIDPPEPASPPHTDAVVSWWVVDDVLGSELEQALNEFVPRWLATTWQFAAVHYFP